MLNLLPSPGVSTLWHPKRLPQHNERVWRRRSHFVDLVAKIPNWLPLDISQVTVCPKQQFIRPSRQPRWRMWQPDNLEYLYDRKQLIHSLKTPHARFDSSGTVYNRRNITFITARRKYTINKVCDDTLRTKLMPASNQITFIGLVSSENYYRLI